MTGWLILMVFLGTWIAFSVYELRRKSSRIVSIGGGFLVGVVLAGLLAVNLTKKSASESIQSPSSASSGRALTSLSPAQGQDAVDRVVAHVEPENLMNIAENADRGSFKAIQNPHGSGILVYFEAPGRVFQPAAWIVTSDGTPFSLTEGTTHVTPQVPLADGNQLLGSGFEGLSMSDALRKFQASVARPGGNVLAVAKAPAPPVTIDCDDLVTITRDLSRALGELKGSANLANRIPRMKSRMKDFENKVPDYCGPRFSRVCDLLWSISSDFVVMADMLQLSGQDQQSLSIQRDVRIETFENELVPALRRAGCEF